jgi:hypothetical protein
MPGKQADVIATFAQRRDIDLNHRQAVEKIGPKTSGFAFRFEIAIRSRNDAQTRRTSRKLPPYFVATGQALG